MGYHGTPRGDGVPSCLAPNVTIGCSSHVIPLSPRYPPSSIRACDVFSLSRGRHGLTHPRLDTSSAPPPPPSRGACGHFRRASRRDGLTQAPPPPRLADRRGPVGGVWTFSESQTAPHTHTTHPSRGAYISILDRPKGGPSRGYDVRMNTG